MTEKRKKKTQKGRTKTGKKKSFQNIGGSSRGCSDGVRVRMYDVGFGDCFLIFIPTPQGEKRVLIDCGTIAAHKLKISDIADNVIRDVTDADGVPRIDVVVMTHRHRDHISGFDRDAWSRVEVREVWMPWTEDPEDPEARRIRDLQTRLALSLQNTFAAKDVNHQVGDLVLNAATNEDALHTLHDGFRGQPIRYYLPEHTDSRQGSREVNRSRRFQTDSLPGVTLYILGPSRDEEVLKDMEPPAGKSYLAVALGADGEGSALKPFGTDWSHDSYGSLDPADEEVIKKVNDGLIESLAVSLDKAINSTSLMLIFRVGRAHLLFSGDAQWGTWRVALEDPEWRDLLALTKFYKVGHHGSHNATPKEFIENILRDDPEFRAMISVKPVANWPSIPRKPLVDALRARSAKVVRSDKKSPVDGFERRGDIWVETIVPIG